MATRQADGIPQMLESTTSKPQHICNIREHPKEHSPVHPRTSGGLIENKSPEEETKTTNTRCLRHPTRTLRRGLAAGAIDAPPGPAALHQVRGAGCASFGCPGKGGGLEGWGGLGGWGARFFK